MINTNDNYKIIGQRIKETRQSKGISQKELASKISMKPNTLSNYERGKRSIKVDVILMIAQALGVSGTYLIEGAEFDKTFILNKTNHDIETLEFKKRSIENQITQLKKSREGLLNDEKYGSVD